MRILLSGSRGLIGAAVASSLQADGHELVRLVRTAHGDAPSEVLWNPQTGVADSRRLEGFDAVVHLAGENIGNGRWTAEKRRAIRDSRAHGTLRLAEALAKASPPPATFLCASAIGYYGDRGNTVLDEQSGPGKGFLAGVCVDWEAAAQPLADKGVRVIPMRFGMVLSAEGGALKKMLPPFRMGVGGVLGSGSQYVSWIAITDVVGTVRLLLFHPDLCGPVNVVAPGSVTNAEFTRTLAKVLRRPAVLPAPAFALRLAFGKMADALLLASTRVYPKRLVESGYAFDHPDLEGALRYVLRR